jgi:serpin B
MKTIITSLFLLPTLFINAQETKSILKNNTDFAFDLYKNLDEKDKEKNVFLSPYSISTAMAMTYSGAGGKTALELAKGMHFNSDVKKSDEEFKWLIDAINSLNNSDVKISVANRLFGDKRFKFNLSYLDGVKNNYNAPLEKLDFVKDLEGSRKKINTWVEDKTNNKIKELIKKNVMDDSTKLVLVNAIYFYGDWAKQFDSSHTQKKDFYLNNESKIQHKMMWQKNYFQYMENNDFQAIRMPYKGNTLYMEVYLPIKKDGISDFEKLLTSENYEKWNNDFKSEEVYLTFPKYKMTCDFSLGEIFEEKMGMKTAFSDAADFYGMVEKKESGLKISKVIHKAFIDVSEKGTEAAAATAVMMIKTTSSAHREPDPFKIFTADHPFIFMIKDKATGSILFMGKVMNPSIKE